jgi:hypothetical protein
MPGHIADPEHVATKFQEEFKKAAALKHVKVEVKDLAHSLSHSRRFV